MSMDDNDGQMIFGDLWGLKLPDICLTGKEKPRKNHTQETCPDRESNPGPLCDRRACYHLLHSGGLSVLLSDRHSAELKVVWEACTDARRTRGIRITWRQACRPMTHGIAQQVFLVWLGHVCARVAHCVTARWRNFSYYCRPLRQYDVWFTCSDNRESLQPRRQQTM